MKKYHLYLFLNNIDTESPVDELMEKGFLPGQIVRMVYRLIGEKYLKREDGILKLTEKGEENLNELKRRGEIIKPTGMWIGQKNVKPWKKPLGLKSKMVYLPSSKIVEK